MAEGESRIQETTRVDVSERPAKRRRVVRFEGTLLDSVERAIQSKRTSESTHGSPSDPLSAELPAPSRETTTKLSAPDSHAPRHARLTTPDGGFTFVEAFPNPLAGSPINDKLAPKFDLRAYIESTGTLSNLDDFATLELLMTTGLTDAGRDRHLKSPLVSR